MAFKHSTNKLYTTKYGEPYLWGSGDVTTIPSNENKIKAGDATENSSDNFSSSVAVGCGRIVVGSAKDFGDSNTSNSGSAYIFDLDGTQLARILPSDGASGDEFGYSIAVGNGRIVVGAPHDDDNGNASGSVYIFDLDGTQLAKITASDGAHSDYFGTSVAIDNGRIVVGAPEDDDNGNQSGSVYIFDLDGTQLAKITASDGTSYDYFGRSVAVGCGRIVVGADQNHGNPSISDKGAAYIFDLDGTQLAKITASDGVLMDSFGYSVSVSNGRIVVGAPHFYPQYEYDPLKHTGSAYIFDLEGNELAKLKELDGGREDWYGYSVAVSNGRIVVGVPYDDDKGNQSGSAYIFDLDGTQLAKITASDGAASDNFGRSVAVGCGRIVVGATGDDNQGSAYIYETPKVYTPYDLIYNEV